MCGDLSLSYSLPLCVCARVFAHMCVYIYLLKLELDRLGVGCSHCFCNLFADLESLLFGGSFQ